eukprot:1158243-Pelagomonas_calceolata.AAC.4
MVAGAGSAAAHLFHSSLFGARLHLQVAEAAARAGGVGGGQPHSRGAAGWHASAALHICAGCAATAKAG